MVLAESGVEVAVLDKDVTEPPETAIGAWEEWTRPGVAQFRQAHTILPRGRAVIESRLRTVWEYLESLGAHRFDMLDTRPRTMTEWSELPDDEKFQSLGARRPVYELAFALAAREKGIDVRRGVGVASLATGASVIDGIPHVTGVETSDGDTLDANLVLDAAGRRSPLAALLTEIGSNPMTEDAEDSRFAYYTRFYRKRSGGDFPRPYVASLLPAGSISILTLPGDNDTWSVTLYATTADKKMRAVRDPEVFERVARSIKARAEWLEGDPVTGVDVMAGISDRERSLIVEGLPVATGVVPLSDAWACTNPSLGRGITMAMMHVDAFVPSISDHVDSPRDVAELWHTATETFVQPWHRATLSADRARNREMDAVRTGLVDPAGVSSTAVDKQDSQDLAFFSAMMSSQHAYRAGLEIGGLFATPQEVMARPEVQTAVAAAAADLPQFPPPAFASRNELESLLG